MVKLADEKLILSLDQGTTNSKALIFTSEGERLAVAKSTLRQSYPQPGWVEEDPEQIWSSIIEVARKVLRKVPTSKVACIGLTNQRETTVLWDRKTLKPVSPAIIWQDRRSSEICKRLRQGGYSELVWDHTGLVIDPYFSATKVMWLFERYPRLKEKADAGRLCFGTVDSFLISRLTKEGIHATDFSNASRTMLFDINRVRWDEELLKLLKIPVEILPDARPSACIFGETDPKHFGRKIPIAGAIGDQQGALFGQAIFKPGIVKNTFGTGCFLLSVTGDQRKDHPRKHLLSTIAWGIDAKVTYAVEGSVLVAGSALTWLEQGLGITIGAPELLKASKKLGENHGVFFVPALSGLGAPVWDYRARGTILGITSGTSKLDLIRAALEAICYQSRDVVTSFEEIVCGPMHALRVDGGASANDELMQFQSDIVGRTVQRSSIQETTAFGAALLAGLPIGIWKNLRELERVWKPGKTFIPRMNLSRREKLLERWKVAVSRSRSWAEE